MGPDGGAPPRRSSPGGPEGNAFRVAWSLRLRTWAPEYDGAQAGPGERSPTVVVGEERSPARWAPLDPVGPPAPVCAFVDGVQRDDAWADLDGPGGERAEALFASCAAGAVVVRGNPPGPIGTALTAGDVHRVVCAPASTADGFAAALVGLDYRWAVAGDGPASHADALGHVRDAAERAAAGEAMRGLDEDGLLVLDGTLQHRNELVGAVGFVKSHRQAYLLGDAERATLAALAPGQRTPLFHIDTGWSRWSWYLRLPGGAPGGWAGLVRVEASASLEVGDAVRLADHATASLPRFASSPVKDARAPQNLVPVGGLERWLRHRLGERDLVVRRLRRALAADRGGP
jgi:hypothetical protein